MNRVKIYSTTLAIPTIVGNGPGKVIFWLALGQNECGLHQVGTRVKCPQSIVTQEEWTLVNYQTVLLLVIYKLWRTGLGCLASLHAGILTPG